METYGVLKSDENMAESTTKGKFLTWLDGLSNNVNNTREKANKPLDDAQSGINNFFGIADDLIGGVSNLFKPKVSVSIDWSQWIMAGGLVVALVLLTGAAGRKR